MKILLSLLQGIAQSAGIVMRKIAVMVASRANWGRVKSVCKAIDEHPNLTLQLIVAASAVDIPLPYKPDAVVQCLVDGDDTQTMTLTTGLFLCQIGGVLERLKPDVLYLHGDRHELSAPAIAAAYQNIKIAHGECAEETGTIDNKVRNVITSLADLYFPVTNLAKEKNSPRHQPSQRTHPQVHPTRRVNARRTY